jgi:RHS repeat-associated protein
MTDGTTTVSYTYNADGMRIGKTVTRANYSETHTYFYNNGHLTYDIITIVDNGTTINHNLLMSYDESGRPLIVTYDHTSYYYLLNLQGDVVGIMNMSGELMVGYTYDAWGNVLSVTGPMASTMGYWNQYRYRGYVYDQETQLYYLQSRYYDPEVGRFLNADIYPTTGQGLTGNNMFAYCGNNPVARKDAYGTVWETVFDLVSLGASIVEVAINPADPWAWAGWVWAL